MSKDRMPRGSQEKIRVSGLCPKRTRFMADYLIHADIASASRAAGVTNVTGARYLGEPEVLEVLKLYARTVMKEAGYDLKKAMEECEEGLAFARLTSNANAFAKFVELRSKLNKLLVDQVNMSATVGFRVHIGIPGVTPATALPTPLTSIPGVADVPANPADIPHAEFTEEPPNPFEGIDLAAKVVDPFGK